MGRSKSRATVLSCFGCGLGGLSRNGSEVATSKCVRNSSNDRAGIVPAPAFCRAQSDSETASVNGSTELPSMTRPASGRTASNAFMEASAQCNSGLATAAEDTALPLPQALPTSPSGRIDGGSATATAAAATAAAAAAATTAGAPLATPTNLSAFTEVFPPWRHPRKPKVRTSRVSPAYGTEDELSAAGLSRATSSGSSFPSYTNSFPSLDEEAGQEGAEGDRIRQSGGGVDEVAPFRPHSGVGGVGCDNVASPSASEEKKERERDQQSQQPLAEDDVEAAAAAQARSAGPAPVGPLNLGSLRKSSSTSSTTSAATATSAAAAVSGVVGRSESRVHSRQPSLGPTAVAPPALAAAAAGVKSPRSVCAPGKVGCTTGGTSRSSSLADRGGAEAGPEVIPMFTRRGASCSGAEEGLAAAAAAAVAAAVPGSRSDDDEPGTTAAAAAAAVVARRCSFAGDSSKSLVGPGSVSSQTTIRTCPSLRPTLGSQVPQEPEELLPTCDSLRLVPTASTGGPAPPPPPASLQPCASLRLAPLTSPRVLTPSPSLRPAPLLLPSTSLPRQQPAPSPREDLLLLLPPTNSRATAPPEPAVVPVGDMMLRLPAPAPPPFQHSPSLGRGSVPPCSFPRGNTLAPLAENPAAINRLAGLQAGLHCQMHPGSHHHQLQPQLQLQQDGGGAVGTGAAAGEAPPTPPAPASAATAGPAERHRQHQPALPQAASLERQGPATTVTAASTAGAAARSGGNADDDMYGSEDYCADDVDAMVGDLLPPSSYRSSAPAIPRAGLAIKEQPVRRTASMEQPRPGVELELRAQALSDLGGPAVSLVIPEAAVEADAQESLGVHAVKWLEDLLPPSPGYKPPVPSRPVGRPAAAPDSFKKLMREID